MTYLSHGREEGRLVGAHRTTHRRSTSSAWSTGRRRARFNLRLCHRLNSSCAACAVQDNLREEQKQFMEHKMVVLHRVLSPVQARRPYDQQLKWFLMKYP